MRRLPVYLLIDTSASMTGAPIEAVRAGISMLLDTLRQDPHALETACLSVITFGTEARQVMPLTEIVDVQPPALEARGATALGAALGFTAERIKAEVIRGSDSQRGDWKPVVFLMTDGRPTDDITAGLTAFRAARPGMVVACAAGPHAQPDVLRQITDTVVTLETADAASIAAFFKWVSASIAVTTTRIDLRKPAPDTFDDLPPPPTEIRKF